MHAISIALRHLVTAVALISEYTIIFDYWIWTPPTWPRNSRQARELQSLQRWQSILRTSLSYAILEPLMYAWLITGPGGANFWILFGCALHIVAVNAASSILVESLKKSVEAHKVECEPLMQAASSEEQVSRTNDKAADVDPASAEAQTNVTATATAQPAPLRAGPHCPHAGAWYGKLALQLPTLTAALINAGIRFEACYLHSEDSEIWLSGFGFGWHVMLLLHLFCFCVAKSMNNFLVHCFHRKFFDFSDKWVREASYRLGGFLSILVIRSGVRHALGQPILSNLAAGFVIIGDLGNNSRPAQDNTERQKQLSEGEWGLFWEYWPVACSSISIIINGSLCIYWWRRVRRNRSGGS